MICCSDPLKNEEEEAEEVTISGQKRNVLN